MYVWASLHAHNFPAMQCTASTPGMPGTCTVLESDMVALPLQCHENLTFCVKVSMLEIYNEVITDLLNPSGSNLQIREDIKRGCYVEDLSEQLIQNCKQHGRAARAAPHCCVLYTCPTCQLTRV
eukprot:GHRQ01030332.1.p1 GENE.GHRQ01030332.1~~GHRQ01030332.1.p1  ORF type:complete len:124 (+),score=38.48 GHRQ01030332.1:519-890(+)